MSPADSLRRARGYTFVETATTLAVVSLLALLVERALSSTFQAERLLNATRTVAERGQRTLMDLRDVVTGSRRSFQDDAVGRGYLAALDLARHPLRVGARLPLVDEARPLGPDEAGDPRTGNVLLVVREAEAVVAVADAALGRLRMIDTYRFVCAYPTQADRQLVSGSGPAIDLVLWRSVRYPSVRQIRAIEDEDERESVVADLVDRFGLDLAWDPTSPADQAFFGLGGDGSVAATPEAAPGIPEDVSVSPGARLVHAGLQLAATDPDSATRRAAMAADDPATWSPDGYEVKVAGPSGARKVWLRLVVEAPAGASSAAHAHAVVVNARDL